MKLSELIAQRYESDSHEFGEDREGVEEFWIYLAEELENEIEEYKKDYIT